MRFLFGRSDQFYPFEACVIEAIKSRLDHPAASRLQAQLGIVNTVQRLTDGKEVNLYRIVHGKPAFDDSLRFPQAEGEALLATVQLAHPDGPAMLKAEAWLANGRLFSLLFDKPPKRFFAGHALDTIRPEVADAVIWTNPMVGRPKGDEFPLDPEDLTGWPRELYAAGQLERPLAPLAISRRAEFIKQIDAQLPPGYLEFAEQMDGAQAGLCKIHGLTGVRKVALAQDNFYILAEDDKSGLAIKDGTKDGGLYVLYYQRDHAVSLKKTFEAALVELFLPGKAG